MAVTTFKEGINKKMAVTNYYTVDGQMLGYKGATGRKDFLRDNVGSVTAEIDQTGSNRTFDGRYRPYGNLLWSTGAPGKFGWIGSWGYRSTGLKVSTQYIRTRHYSYVNGAWITVDPLWPFEQTYLYARLNPDVYVDLLGLDPLPLFIPTDTTIGGDPDIYILPGASGSGLAGGAGATAGGVAAAPVVIVVCSLIAIGDSVWELCHYEPGHPGGILTHMGDYLGKCLGDYLYPEPPDASIPAPPTMGRRKPNRPDLDPLSPFYPTDPIPESPFQPRPECQVLGLPPCPPKITHDPPQANGHTEKWLIGGQTGTCYGDHTHIVFYERLPPSCDCQPVGRFALQCFGLFVPI